MHIKHFKHFKWPKLSFINCWNCCTLQKTITSDPTNLHKKLSAVMEIQRNEQWIKSNIQMEWNKARESEIAKEGWTKNVSASTAYECDLSKPPNGRNNFATFFLISREKGKGKMVEAKI